MNKFTVITQEAMKEARRDKMADPAMMSGLEKPAKGRRLWTLPRNSLIAEMVHAQMGA